MFNESQKLEYIVFEEKNSDSIRRYFNRVSGYEQKFNMDIADMDEHLLTETLLSLKITKESYLSQMVSLLKGYINWVILNKKGGSNAIFSINAESLRCKETIASQMIKDPDELREILDLVLDDVNYENRSKKARLLIWLLYSGLSINEIRLLKKDSLHLEEKSVVLMDNTFYKIREEAISLWDDCVNMTYVEKKNGRAENSKNKATNEYCERLLVNNDYLFRSINSKNINVNNPQHINYFIETVKDIFKELDDSIKIKVRPESIRESGLFYELYLKEKAGEHITPEFLLSHFRINNINKSAIITKKRSLQIDYGNWKLSFGYIL